MHRSRTRADNISPGLDSQFTLFWEERVRFVLIDLVGEEEVSDFGTSLDDTVARDMGDFPELLADTDIVFGEESLDFVLDLFLVGLDHDAFFRERDLGVERDAERVLVVDVVDGVIVEDADALEFGIEVVDFPGGEVDEVLDGLCREVRDCIAVCESAFAEELAVDLSVRFIEPLSGIGMGVEGSVEAVHALSVLDELLLVVDLVDERSVLSVDCVDLDADGIESVGDTVDFRPGGRAVYYWVEIRDGDIEISHNELLIG